MLAEIRKIWLSHLALRKPALKQCRVEWITLWTAFSFCSLVAYVSSHSYSWEVRDGVSDCCDPLPLCCRDARSPLPHSDQTLVTFLVSFPKSWRQRQPMLRGNFVMLFCKELGTCQIRPYILQLSGELCLKKKKKAIFNQCPPSTERWYPGCWKYWLLLQRQRQYTHLISNNLLACCLFKLPQYCCPQALGHRVCSERAVMKPTFLPRTWSELPSMYSQHPVSRLPKGTSQRSCLRNFFGKLVSSLCFLEDIFSAYRSSMPGLSSLPELSQQHTCSIVSCFTWSFTVWDLNICSSKKRLCQPPEKNGIN